MPEIVKMKPLIFGTRSVLAWQQSAKTQTRRLVKPQPMNPRWYLRQQEYDSRWAWWTHLRNGRGCWAANVCQPYAVGDLLWIREGLIWLDDLVAYAADKMPVDHEGGIVCWPWKRNKLPAMFMPRWACRYYARVVSVRPERLQDITTKDAVAEGTLEGIDTHPSFGSYRDYYHDWWDSLHKKPGTRSEDNPMIWRYELEGAVDGS